jgi:hypothetical protein
MGSGGAPALSATRSTDHPKISNQHAAISNQVLIAACWQLIAEPGKSWHGRSQLLADCCLLMRLSLAGVEVDRAIRTGQLCASPRLHSRPIDVVVCHGPDSETWSCGRFPA